ncbi:hypothetical protein DFH09DRAFT_1293773 [Mycena vulgaris]|nr:hypothetical protein DFH09DRAFT_1293773 [Mycena vulgaris]
MITLDLRFESAQAPMWFQFPILVTDSSLNSSCCKRSQRDDPGEVWYLPELQGFDGARRQSREKQRTSPGVGHPVRHWPMNKGKLIDCATPWQMPGKRHGKLWVERLVEDRTLGRGVFKQSSTGTLKWNFERALRECTDDEWRLKNSRKSDRRRQATANQQQELPSGFDIQIGFKMSADQAGDQLINIRSSRKPSKGRLATGPVVSTNVVLQVLCTSTATPSGYHVILSDGTPYFLSQLNEALGHRIWDQLRTHTVVGVDKVWWGQLTGGDRPERIGMPVVAWPVPFRPHWVARNSQTNVSMPFSQFVSFFPSTAVHRWDEISYYWHPSTEWPLAERTSWNVNYITNVYLPLFKDAK